MQLPQVARVLPGPAGKLQELAAAGALQQATPEALGLTAGSTSGISPSQAANQYDAAFLSSSWTAAKAFAEEDAVVAGPVRSIKSAKELAVGKVPRMLLLLSSYHPSGAGSAFSKVKDPTGTMGAALHSSALQQQPQLGPGCVLLLQNVSVLTPNPGSCYLAVTADNIVQVWGPDQTGRSIRNVTHQPAATQHPQQQQQQVPQQQQQQVPQQQQRQQSLHTQQQQQQQQGPFGKTRPGQQQRPGTAAAAAAAASGADSRQTNPFIPPPSPDIMSVFNQMSSKSAGPPAAAVGPVGPGSHQPHFRPQQQQQQQWQQRQIEQQGQFSPALSGAGNGPSVQHQTQQQQQQRPCLGSMAPPPPRQPAAGAAATHHTSQQQQHGRNGLASTQQQGQEPVMGQTLFKGWSQPNGMMGTQGRANPAAAAGATGAAAGGGTNMIGASGASGFGHRAPGLGSGPVGRLGGRATAAAAAVDDDEDVEVDENIVAAIFGSQVPKPVAPILSPQQQQQGSNVTGAFRGVTGQHTPSAAGSRLAPGSSWVQQQKTPGSISSSGNQQVRGQGTGRAGVGPSSTPDSAAVSMGGAVGPAGSIAGKMGPPAPTLQQQQQWGMPGGSQQQQKWGMPGGSQQQQQQQGTQDRPPLSGVGLGRGAVGFGGGVLGKRPAAHLSLLDDLVDGLDDF